MKRTLAVSLALLVLAPLTAWAQRTSVSGDVPIYANGGLPDLTPDPKRFNSQMEIVDRLFDAASCELIEGSVGGTGYRRLLRFDIVLINSGDGDLLVGDPTDPNNRYHAAFEFSPCHRHYHITGFSNYQLLRLDHTVAAQGHKQAFCLEDIERLSATAADNPRFTCDSQGIQAGWADVYNGGLPCQWIDVTGVPPGQYTLKISVNPSQQIVESNYDNDTLLIDVVL